MHPIEADIRNWSKNFLEVPSDKLNGLPPCPYAADAWLKNKVKFDINTGFEGLTKQIKEFDNHKYDIVIWACDEDIPEMQYLDGYCDGINEVLSVLGKDMHLMVFHPDFDAITAGLEFLDDGGITNQELEYAMVFVQKLSTLDDAALSLEKSGYYQYFPKWIYQSLVVDRRRLRNAGSQKSKNGKENAWRRNGETQKNDGWWYG